MSVVSFLLTLSEMYTFDDETEVAQINMIRPRINLPPIKEISPTRAQALAVVDQSLQAQLVKEA